MAPGYTVWQALIGQALTTEQQRLNTVGRAPLQPTDVAAFQRLFEDAPGLYALTQLKHEPRDCSASAIKRAMQHGTQLEPFDALAQRVLPALEMSHESRTY